MAHEGSFNKVVLLGTLEKNPEFSEGQDTVRCNLFLATKETYSYGGEAKTKTETHHVMAWGKLAKACKSTLEKGMTVFVEGKLVTNFYGNRKSVYVSAQTIVPMSGMSKGGIKEDEPTQDEPTPY